MTYQTIKKLRLNHGAGCTEPIARESKIYFDWAMSKQMEREVVEAPTEPFRMVKINMISKNRSLINILKENQMATRDAMKRDFVQLAHIFDSKKHSPAGWYVSVKMDGMRAFWDGGQSRGLLASSVPYANCVKDARYKEPPICTGLFSRYGNPIQAPDWFLDSLPNYPLDGEMWSGNNSFQQTMATVKDLNPSEAWRDVKYMVFDSPPPALLFQDGDVRVQGYKVLLRDCLSWWTKRGGKGIYMSSFEATHNFLCSDLKMTSNLKVHTQWQLPFNTSLALEEINQRLETVTDEGGEGLMLRKPSSLWEPKRSYNILKVKTFQDAEATVTGYVTGRSTNKGGKLLGLMGSLVTNFNGKRLELSGFTDAERVLIGTNGQSAREWAQENPGVEVPNWITSDLFPRGSQVTFRFRELTDDSVPKEARYHRRANV